MFNQNLDLQGILQLAMFDYQKGKTIVALLQTMVSNKWQVRSFNKNPFAANPRFARGKSRISLTMLKSLRKV